MYLDLGLNLDLHLVLDPDLDFVIFVLIYFIVVLFIIGAI